MSSFSVELTNGEHARSNHEHPQPPTGRKDFPLLNFKVTLATTPVDRNGGFERTTEKRKKKNKLVNILRVHKFENIYIVRFRKNKFEFFFVKRTECRLR